MGFAESLADLDTLTLPTSAGNGSTLEPMLGSMDGTYASGSNHAQGVGSCYLDQDNIVHITFNDGSGAVWNGQAGFFACYTNSGVAVPTTLYLTPASAQVPQAGTIQWGGVLSGNTAQTLAWSVDGIAGGNATVGTIDSTGLYTAPTAPGSHTISAVSSVTATSATATVIVIGASAIQLSLVGATLTVDAGISSVAIASGNWQLIAGSVNLAAASMPSSGPYGITVSWSGVKALAPDGSTLSYTDGSATMASTELAMLALYDPANGGGSCVALYINGTSAPPTGSQTLLDITSVPGLSAIQTFGLPS